MQHLSKMMQLESTGNVMCNTRGVLFQSFIILSLVTSVACLTDNTANTSIISTRVAAPRNLEEGITVPGFGGCFDTDTDRLTCSIGPDNCSANTDYLRPDEMTDIGKCDSPFRVEIGRCGNLESCSPFASACEDQSKYVTSDPTCSLVEDKSIGTNMITYYPFCRVKAEIDVNRPTRCVLSDDECIAGREDFLSFTRASYLSRCFCSDVPIGMCSKKDTTPITMESSFCAVADYDCPDEYEFMPAYELSDMDSPPRECRLCEKKDLEEYDLHQSVVESGRCLSDEGTVGLCALESTECNTYENETFQSSIEIVAEGGFPCWANHFSGGECTNADDEEVHCTNYKDACETPSAFAARNTCTMFSDTASPNNEPMYFGQCKKKQLDGTDLDERGYRCVWNRSECNETEEEWVPASKPTDWYDGCKCEDVETGACDDNGTYYCAVSSDACAEGHTYTTSLETREKGIDCRLCQRSRIAKTITTPPTNNPTKGPTLKPTKVPTKVPTRKTTKKPTSRPIGIDDDVDDGVFYEVDDQMTFAPTTSAQREYYGDSLSKDYDEDEAKRNFDVILIISGSVGGTILFTCIALIFYYRDPLPVKLYLTEKEVETNGEVV